MGGDILAENQALASFDFLGTTGDSDSDEEEDEEEEEKEEEDEEGDPTVSVEDEFTSGFVEDALEPMTGRTAVIVVLLKLRLMNACGFQRGNVRRAGSSTLRSLDTVRARLVVAAVPNPSNVSTSSHSAH